MFPLGLDEAGPTAGAVGPSGREINTWVDPEDGRYYLSVDVEGLGKGIGWAANGIFARVGKLDRAGHWIWLASDKAAGFARPGQFYKPGQFAGIVHGCLCVTDWNGQYRIYDQDTGLYVGSLFSDGYRGPRPDENLISVEFNEGHVYRPPVTGEVYALAGDASCLKLFRVTGLKDIERFQAPVVLGEVGK